MRALGATRQAIYHRAHGAHYEAVSLRVLRASASPVTAAQRILAAVLDGGAGTVLSHSSAAAWWGLPGFDCAPFT